MLATENIPIYACYDVAFTIFCWPFWLCWNQTIGPLPCYSANNHWIIVAVAF